MPAPATPVKWMRMRPCALVKTPPLPTALPQLGPRSNRARREVSLEVVTGGLRQPSFVNRRLTTAVQAQRVFLEDTPPSPTSQSPASPPGSLFLARRQRQDATFGPSARCRRFLRDFRSWWL